MKLTPQSPQNMKYTPQTPAAHEINTPIPEAHENPKSPQHMKEVNPGQVVGADAFFPVWVFCIIRAKMPNLSTMVNYLKGYLNPSLRYSEIGYYVTCLEGACVYIQVYSTQRNVLFK